jgi:hypothetical protein
MFGLKALKTVAAAGALALMASGAQASVVNFSDGVGNNQANTYVEDGFLFEGVRLVSGNCFNDPVTNPESCAAENRNELIRMTRVDGSAFDLTSIWFQILGQGNGASNGFLIQDMINGISAVFTQPTYLTNEGYTVTLTQFMGVTELFFSSSPDPGNLRIDNVGAAPSAVPVPAAGFLLIGALGGLAALRRRRKA